MGPRVLLKRQIGRAQRSGRLITVDQSIPEGDLHRNCKLKQKKAIKGIEEVLSICEETGGYGIVYDNTPDFRHEKPLPPIYERDGANPPTGDFQGYKAELSVAGMAEYISKKIQSD